MSPWTADSSCTFWGRFSINCHHLWQRWTNSWRFHVSVDKWVISKTNTKANWVFFLIRRGITENDEIHPSFYIVCKPMFHHLKQRLPSKFIEPLNERAVEPYNCGRILFWKHWCVENSLCSLAFSALVL